MSDLESPRVTARDGQWFVTCVVAGPFNSHAEACGWVDKNTNEGRADLEKYQRIRISFSEKR